VIADAQQHVLEIRDLGDAGNAEEILRIGSG